MVSKEFSKLVKGKQVIAVYCNQWGDTGKGKFSDYFANYWADVIARGTGGNNAGHTVVVNGKKRVFHLIPAGIVYDSLGKINVLGQGMVLDPFVLEQELEELETEGLTYNNLRISRDAHVILPFHIARDKQKDLSQKNGGIGSTGRGIGPCYTDKVARRGIRLFEFLDENIFRKKLEKIQPFYEEQEIDIETIIQNTRRVAERLSPFVCDTTSLIHTYISEGKKILLEGAQGLLLSVEFGTYPYVTSSDPSLNGMASGVGIPANAIDLALGIIKFPFMTRVGGGPFPTELGGHISETYCGEEGHEEAKEQETHKETIHELLSSENEFEQGIGLRIQAQEYGATTGRPRRIGWTDAVAAKYAATINGPLFILTKADCLEHAEEFKLCYGYKTRKGTHTTTFRTEEELLRNITPQYKTYKGYGPLNKTTSFNDLPLSLKEAIQDFEKFTKGTVIGLSLGAERDATLWKDTTTEQKIEQIIPATEQ